MKYLVIVLLCGLVACNGNKKDKETTQPVDTLKHSIGETNPDPQGTLTGTLMNLPVYKDRIPVSVMNYLSTSMKEWSLPDPESWEKYWWDQYKKEKTLVNFISGDFNCDTKPDYALILRDKDSTTGAWVLLAKDSSYTHTNLELISKEPGMIGIGLELLEKGKHGDLNGDNPKTITSKCEGVTIVFFEKAAHSWYWEKGKWKMIYTAD